MAFVNLMVSGIAVLYTQGSAHLLNLTLVKILYNLLYSSPTKLIVSFYHLNWQSSGLKGPKGLPRGIIVGGIGRKSYYFSRKPPLNRKMAWYIQRVIFEKLTVIILCSEICSAKFNRIQLEQKFRNCLRALYIFLRQQILGT